MSTDEVDVVGGTPEARVVSQVATVPVAAIEKGLQVDVHCRVLSCDAQHFPRVVPFSAALTEVNGVPVFNRAELREALGTLVRQRGAAATVTLGFSALEATPEFQSLGKAAADLASRGAGNQKAAHQGQGGAPKERKTVNFAPPETTDENFDDLESCNSDDPDHVGVVAHQDEEAEEADEYAPENLMLSAVQRIAPGGCIIILTQGINPAMYIEAAARDNGVSVMCVSAADRVKTKVRLDEFRELLVKGLKTNVWIMFEAATKSISSLQVLIQAVDEVRAANAFHPKGRLFLLCEPHPHFPKELLKGSITLRFRTHPSGTQRELEETMHDSKSRIDVLQGLKGTAKDGKDEMLISFKRSHRRVVIANTVDVVMLENDNEVAAAAAEALPKLEIDTKETGLRLEAQHIACRGGESLISLSKMGNENRFAVGNNTGHIIMLDMNALPMMMFRPLKNCIWDINFATQFDFATACEDGTASVMNYNLRTREITTKACAKFESDVFAVSFVNSSVDSPIVSGGLANTICVLHSDRQQATHCATATSTQVIAKTHTGQVLVGGGTGSTSILDPETATIVHTTTKHQKKVPAASCIPNVGVTGSFDKTMRVWDLRDRLASTHSLVLADVVTAVGVDGNELTCCSGNSLYVWDLRNLKSVLDSRMNAWKGLTRGLAIFSSTKNIVTASVDGIVRVWKYS